jgi:hypothetical protein
VAAIVLLVHVRGEIGLEDEPAEALADQTAAIFAIESVAALIPPGTDGKS